MFVTMYSTVLRAPSLPGSRPPYSSVESARVCSRRNSIVNAGASGAGAVSVGAGVGVGSITAGAARHAHNSRRQ
jgi:hypothetical protein